MKFVVAMFILISSLMLSSKAWAEGEGFVTIKNPEKTRIDQKLILQADKEMKGYYNKNTFIPYSFLDVSGPIKVQLPPLWVSTVLANAAGNSDLLDDIVNQIVDNGKVLNEEGAEVALLTNDEGLIVTTSQMVIGGFLEPVYAFNRKMLAPGEKYLGYVNKNCFLVIRQGDNERTLIPNFSGEYSEQAEYADFDYGPTSKELNVLRPLITKDGSILGWARNNGYVYDRAGNILAIAPRCETITVSFPEPPPQPDVQ